MTLIFIRNNNTTNVIEVFNTGTYSVIGYNTLGCPSNIATHELVVRDAPQVEIKGVTEITSGDTTELIADVIGDGPFSFYWSPTRETTQSINIIASDVDLSKLFSVVTYDAYGCYNFAVTVVTKHSAKITGRKEFCEGDSSQLIAITDGALSYKWSTGDTSSTITVKYAGAYSLITEYESGLVDTLKFNVVVHEKPDVKIKGESYICRGDSLILNSISNVKDFYWNTGTVDSFIVVRDSGEYINTVVSEFGCVNADTVNVTVRELPNVEILGHDSIIEGTSIFLEASGANTYKWEKPDTTLKVIEVFDEMRYRVVGTDAYGCSNSAIKDVYIIPIPHVRINDTINGFAIACDGDRYKLIASGAETYLWDTGSTADTIYVTESRVYSLKGCLSNGQCQETTFSVEFSPRPKMMKIDGNTKFCPDSFSVLTAHTYDNSLIGNFVWSTGENSDSIKVSEANVYFVYSDRKSVV